MFNIKVVSRISSEVNSPPLSVILDPISPNIPVDCAIKVSITWLGFFRSINIDNVYFDHMSIMFSIQPFFHCLRTIATFSLHFEAIRLTTISLDGVLA